MITLDQIKSLRNRTGISINLCKEALEKANGNEELALDILEKTCLEKVSRRPATTASKGIVRTYEHHGSCIGVMVEINCETDSVARNEEFKEFATNVAMQIASMNPEYIGVLDIPKDIAIKKRDIFAEQLGDSIRYKSPQAIQGILDGKLMKWASEICLMEQQYVLSDSKQSIKQMCDLLSAKFGEKIVIKRFVRYEIG